MKVLNKITCRYSPAEDRVSLSSEAASGVVMRLWLTRRLVTRLILLLRRSIRGNEAEASGEFGVMAQRKTLDSQVESVLPVECHPETPDFLISAIDLKIDRHGLVLNFSAELAPDLASLNLSGEAGSRIIEALEICCNQAEWNSRVPDGSWCTRKVSIH